MNKKHVIIAALVGIAVGTMFAERVRALPTVGAFLRSR